MGLFLPPFQAHHELERYRIFGLQIQASGETTQTFVVQATGGGTSLVTERAAANRGSGAVPASRRVGAESGRGPADRTLDEINQPADAAE